MNINEKRLYIYNNIQNNNINHSYIKPYIINNNILYSENNNGIFINLSILNEKYIEELYNIIYKYIQNNKNYNKNRILNNNIIIKEKEKEKESKIYKNIENIDKIDIFLLNNLKI